MRTTSTSENLIPVAEVIRVSRGVQADDDKFGIPSQRNANQRTAAQYGLNVVKTFEIIDVSGKDILKTPEISELTEMMWEGRIKGVVAREFSRLMRPQRIGDWILLQQFQDTKCVLYLPEGSVDFSTRNGRLMGGVKSLIAGDELEQIRERLFTATEENRKQGGRCCSRMPMGVGYEKLGKKIGRWFYNRESHKVLEAYEAVLTGESNATVARILGVSHSGALAILRNPIYMGWRVYDMEVAGEGKKVNGRQSKSVPRRRRAEDRIIRRQVIDQPLISPERWRRAVEIINTRAEKRMRERDGCFTAYNGFVFCDECGHLMSPVYRRNDHGERTNAYYCCLGNFRKKICKQPYVKQEDLEAAVDRLLGIELHDPGVLSRMADVLAKGDVEGRRREKIEQRRADLKALHLKNDRIKENFDDGHYTKTQRDEKLAKNAKVIADLSAELERLEDIVGPALPVDRLHQMFGVFREWKRLNREQRRSLLQVAVPKIRVRNGRLVSFYRLHDREPNLCVTSLDQTFSMHIKSPRWSSAGMHTPANTTKDSGGRRAITVATDERAGVWINLVA